MTECTFILYTPHNNHKDFWYMILMHLNLLYFVIRNNRKQIEQSIALNDSPFPYWSHKFAAWTGVWSRDSTAQCTHIGRVQPCTNYKQDAFTFNLLVHNLEYPSFVVVCATTTFINRPQTQQRELTNPRLHVTNAEYVYEFNCIYIYLDISLYIY